MVKVIFSMGLEFDTLHKWLRLYIKGVGEFDLLYKWLALYFPGCERV